MCGASPGAGSGADHASSESDKIAASSPLARAAPSMLIASTRRAFGAELHVMRASKLFLREIYIESRRQLLAIPIKCPQELLVVGTAFVPLRKQTGSDVDAFAVPRLADHVVLPSGLLRVRLLGRLRVREVEVTRHAVHKGVDPQSLAIGGDRNVDR